VERHLLDLLNKNKLPHGLIFVGPEGVGKATMAYRLARTLLAYGATPVDNGPGLFGDAPAIVTEFHALDVEDDHAVARQMRAGAHPDLMVVGRDDSLSASGQIVAEDVRKIPPFLSLKPSVHNGWRVVIVDNAHTMNPTAQNSLLKVFEEPPPCTLLILVVHQLGSILPTIRSRAQDVHFNPLTPPDFARCLKYLGYHLGETDMKWVIALSNGCPGKVAGILDIDGLSLIKSFLDLWHGWPKLDEQEWYVFVENLSQASEKEAYRFILSFWQWWAAAILRAKVDDQRRADLHALLQHTETMAMIDQFPLARLIALCDKLREHTGAALGLTLEPHQVLYTARDMMMP
jgi:DNA polymerase-3 subunit delta'